MTSLFWQKRPSKKLTATLLFVTVLVTVVIFRHSIAIKSIEYLAKSPGLHITCLDFSLDWRLSLNIQQACITTPLGTALVNKAIWQPGSNVLSIEQIQVKHIATNNKVEKEIPKEEQTNTLDLPDTLPKLSISSLEIDSFILLQPLYVSVNTVSSNELSITGDVNASIKMQQNTVGADIVWRLSDLTKWIPQAQQLFQDNAELLKDVALDEVKIQTSLTFNGEALSANSSVDLVSRFYVSSCPIDAVIKGDLLVDVDLTNLDIGLDLSQLSNDLSMLNCPLLREYFAEDDWPQLSFNLPQKMAINATQISLPKLQIIDKQNTNRSIVLKDLNFKTTGELDVNYNISVKQPIKTKQIQAGMLDFQAQGTVSANLTTLNTQGPVSWKIFDDTNRLAVSDVKMDALLIGNLTTEFSLHHAGTKPLQIKGTVNSADIQNGDIKLAKITSTFVISGADFNDMYLSADSQLSKLIHSDASVKSISNHIYLNIKDFDALSFSGNSILSNLAAQKIKFLPIAVTHTGQVSLANMTVSSQHKIGLEQGFMIELEQQQTTLKVQIKQQDIINLQSIIAQLQEALFVTQGNLSAAIVFTLPQKDEQIIATGKVNFQDIFVKYQDYLLNNITYQTPLTFNSAGLQLTGSTLHIDTIDAGVPISQLEANVIAIDSVFRLKQVHGELFNGKFSLLDLWLDGRDQQFNINFQNIDLAQVVALQQQPGIKITGNIDGDLPLIMNKQGIRIEDGWASSLTGGKLTIINNPSFDAIKVQQPKLALLENLDFTHLKSKVKFNPDGWVFFDFALKGNNPDKKQSVNFNYSHQENIFSLLESIRLVKSVENKIEHKITQGEKK